ncbi:MAG: hypothetical protein DME26_03975, partial [Verrucomicrobia bacterium]
QIAAGALYANLKDMSGNDHIIGSNGGVVSANTWQHVAVTYDKASGNATLYVNGAVVAGPKNVGQNLTLQTSYPLDFGIRRSGSGTTPYGGAEDEIKLFNRALSQAEIQAIINTGSACISTPTLTVNDHRITGGPIPGNCDPPAPKSSFTRMGATEWLDLPAVSSAGQQHQRKRLFLGCDRHRWHKRGFIARQLAGAGLLQWQLDCDG